MTTAEHRAHHVVETYLHTVPGSEGIPGQGRLEELITEAIQKAVVEDREVLRDRMACTSVDPCGFELCAHHKALVAAVMSVQEGRPAPPRSLFSRPVQ